MGNAEIGSFLTHLGLSVQAIRYITAASHMAYLDLATARRLDIEVIRKNGNSRNGRPLACPNCRGGIEYGAMGLRCTKVFDVDTTYIDRLRAQASEEAKQVSPDRWAEAFVEAVDRVKYQLRKMGDQAWCSEA